jgi:hypothetical protein
MSLVRMIREQVSFSNLPLWRKIAIGVCLALAVFVGAMTFNKEIDIYGSAPDHSVASTGRTYPLKVNHGSLRYLTADEYGRLDFWESTAESVAGAAMLVAFLLFVTYRDPLRRVSRALPFIAPENSHRT